MPTPSIHIGAKSGSESGLKKMPERASQYGTPKSADWMTIINEKIAELQPIKINDKVSFFRLLATMINAGVSIVKALSILRDQTANKHMKQIISGIVDKIESGSSFSAAIASYPKTFTDSQIGMVEAGEASGQLNKTLLEIATNSEKQAAFYSKIKSAMIYPVVIILVMIAAGIAVMVLVMPKIKDLFEGLGGELPYLTQMLIDISDFLVGKTLGLSNILWILLVAAGLLALFFKWKSTKMGRILWTKFVFITPLFGKLNKKAALASFCRSLSTMTKSGIPIIKALRITADSVGNPLYQKRVNQIADDVKHGITIAENMKDDTYYFPNMVVGMMGVAEQTAQIDSISGKLADYYEGEVDDMVKGLSSLMEPIIMVLLGGAIAFLVIAVMEPILSASDLAV
jgi:type IV pilus assembly protein PilC